VNSYVSIQSNSRISRPFVHRKSWVITPWSALFWNELGTLNRSPLSINAVTSKGIFFTGSRAPNQPDNTQTPAHEFKETCFFFFLKLRVVQRKQRQWSRFVAMALNLKYFFPCCTSRGVHKLQRLLRSTALPPQPVTSDVCTLTNKTRYSYLEVKLAGVRLRKPTLSYERWIHPPSTFCRQAERNDSGWNTGHSAWSNIT